MEAVNRIVQTLLQLLMQITALVASGIVAIELWLRAQLTLLAVPQPLQTAALVVAALLLIAAALQFFGGLIRIAVVLILVLVVIHILLPVIQT